MIFNWIVLLLWLAYVYSAIWALNFAVTRMPETPRPRTLFVLILFTGPIVPLVHLLNTTQSHWVEWALKKLHLQPFRGICFFDEDGLELPLPGAEPLLLLRNLVQASAVFHANEIFLDFQNDSCRIRLRKNNKSRDLPQLSKKVGESLVEAVKELARIEQTDSQAIAEGFFTIRKDRIWATWIVNATVTASGEKLSVLVLPPRPGTMGKQNLMHIGISEQSRYKMRKLLKEPSGLILLCVPPHHGGTTTAYALLREALERCQRTSAAIETTAKFPAPEINQIEMSEAPGVPAADLVRNALNLDAGILAVLHAEDRNTIAAALEAAEERLVLLRLTDSDPLDAMRKVIAAADRCDLGQLLKGIIMVRLADAACPTCSVIQPLPAAYQAYFNAAGLSVNRLLKTSPRSCRQCQRTGSFGRLPIVAVVPAGNRLQSALASEEKIWSALFQKEVGLPLLMYEGYLLASQGKITLKEAENAVAGF